MCSKRFIRVFSQQCFIVEILKPFIVLAIYNLSLVDCFQWRTPRSMSWWHFTPRRAPLHDVIPLPDNDSFHQTIRFFVKITMASTVNNCKCGCAVLRAHGPRRPDGRPSASAPPSRPCPSGRPPHSPAPAGAPCPRTSRCRRSRISAS